MTDSASATPPQVGGLSQNVAAALAYLWIVAILWLVIEPFNKNRFVRFHSFQALAFGVVSIVVSIVLGFIPILGWVIGIFWSLAVFALWLVCLVKAYGNQWFKLPVIGDFAEQQAGPA